jgi:hypothetical protein
MADENKVTITLDLDADTFKGQLKKVEKEAEKQGDKIAKGMSEGIKAGLAVPLVSEGISLIKTLGRAIFDGFINGIKAAEMQSQSITQLNQALSLAGDYSRDASSTMIAFAESLEMGSGHSAELLTNMLALSKAFGASNDEAMGLVRAATELSAVTGMSLESSTRALGQTLNGNIGTLAKFVPALKGMGDEALKSGAAIDFVNQRFGGTAATKMDSYSGAIFRLNKALDDSHKAMGMLVTQSPAVQSALGELSEVISRALNVDTAGADIARPIIMAVTQIAQVLNIVLVGSVEFVYKKVRAVFSAMGYIMVGFAEQAIGIANLVTGKSSETLVKLEDMAKSMREKLGENVENAFDMSFSGNISAALGQISGAVAATSGQLTAMGETATHVNQKFVESMQISNDQIEAENARMKAAFDATQNYFDQVAGHIDQVINQTISASLANLGAAMVGAGAGFSSFASQAGNILGDFFINMGMTIIAADQAIIALKASLTTFFGGLGIAAGIGLVIAGGALKALSGGPSGGAAASAVSTPTPTGGGVNAGLDSGTADTTGAISEIAEREEPQTNVNVNVSGIVTNPRETAEQIASLLKDGFETNALSVRGFV